jgi:hypothetical protein
MPLTTVTADVDQSLDIHADIPTQVPFDPVLPLDHPAEAIDLVLAQVLDPKIRTDVGLGQDPEGGGTPDAIDIGEGHLQPFLAGKIYASNPRHVPSMLSATSYQQSAISTEPKNADSGRLAANFRHPHSEP